MQEDFLSNYMRILITTDLYTTATNGVVTSVKNLFDELTGKGHDVRILTLSENSRSYKDGAVSYIRSMPLEVYPDVRMPLTYRHKLIKELIYWRPDIIHSQCEIFSMQFAKKISRKTGAPIVHTYHTMYEEYIGYVLPGRRFGKWVVRCLTRSRLKKVSLVIVPTAKMEKVLTEYSLSKPIRIVPTGISLEQHKKRITEEYRHVMRVKLGISDDRFVLINLGRLGTEKNVDELLRLFAKALKTNDKLMFLIVGDGPAKAQLEKLAETLRITDHVIFTGMVKPSVVHEYYKLGDVFVSASTSETQGLTYIEAAANGLPLLCRKDPCLEDIIVNGENGFEYTCDKDFSDALSYIYHNSEWREEARNRGKEIASRFDKTMFVNTVEEIYNTVLGR